MQPHPVDNIVTIRRTLEVTSREPRKAPKIGKSWTQTNLMFCYEIRSPPSAGDMSSLIYLDYRDRRSLACAVSKTLLMVS